MEKLMKKLIITLLIAVTVLALTAVFILVIYQPSATIRVMSYNLLADNGEGGYDWGTPLWDRADNAIKCIKKLAPDVIGMQEVTLNWYAELREKLKDYETVNSTDPENGSTDEICTALMYNTKVLTLEETELIHYKASYWGIGRVRYINMALFKHNESGVRFIMISTHFDAGQEEGFEECRLSQANELAEKINEYHEKYNCPIISVGDYNCGTKEEPYKNLLSAASLYDANSKCQPETIDHILCTEDVETLKFKTVNYDYIKTASDHLPIYADLKVK